MTSQIRKVDNIVVTYYVSPHLFYFKYKDDECDDVLSEINNKVEKYVEKYIEKCRPDPYSPKVGEIVLCHYITDCVNKWIRARVDCKRNYRKEKFILWALDFGFPIETEPHWIRKLMSADLKIVYTGLIFKGGLYDIVPSAREWNIADSTEEARKTKKWTTKAIQVVEKYIHEADILTFRCRAYLKDHFFGSLVVRTNTGSKVVVEDVLRNMKEGVDGNNFVKEFCELDQLSYWDRHQQDAIFKIYENNSDHYLYGVDDQPSQWITSTDNVVDKNKGESRPQKFPSTNDNKNDDTEGVPVDLSTKYPDVSKLLSRKGRIQSNSCNTLTGSTSSKPIKVYPEQDFDVKSINTIPMNKRLAVAQQKFIEKGKITAMKQARIDEMNKKLMGLTFPAGFIVNSKVLKEKEEEIKKRNNEMNQDFDSDDDLSFVSTKPVNKMRYQKAQEDEECFTIDHNQRILVHNHENLPITSIKNISEANFSQEIHKVLAAKNINEIFRVQTFGWPSIMRGSSLILVSNAKTGKTWTYLPALCSLIIERIEDGQVVDGIGPLTIIACTSSQEVEAITRHCQHLLRKTEIKCVKAYGFKNERKVVAQLLNGSEILVATIPRLYRLMLNDLQLFNKERIFSLVFDNIDLVYDQFSREINEIYNSICGQTRYQPLQMIVTSRTWHKVLEKFYMTSHFTLCIGSCIEAAVYARTDMKIELLNQQFKYDQLISSLSDEKYRFELTIVICNKPEDVEELLKNLKSTPNKIWHCHDKSDSFDIAKIKELIEKSKSGNLKVLICTDDVLTDLDIRRAQHIIHFSLPPTWTQFTFRFSVLMDYYDNLLSAKMNFKPAATSLVFLDDTNDTELPRLIDFMQMRGKGKIPEEVLKFVQLKRIEREEQASNIYKSFCNDLLTVGVCHGRLSCQHRHILTKFDRSRSDIPRNGSVKFDVIAVLSPIHFTVRLREYRRLNENKWNKLRSCDEFLTFSMAFANHFSDVTNHIIHYPINLGDLCVVGFDSNDHTSYHRVKILKIETKKIGMLDQVDIEVLLIDSNERKSCCSAELMLLPDMFKNVPYQAVDLRIAEIRPCDFDSEWDSTSLTFVKNWIEDEKHNYCQGNIKLSIMDTLWVDSIDLIEVLHSIREEVKNVSIRKKLLDGNFGVKDSNAMELLNSLAEKAGLFEPNNEDIALDGLISTEFVDTNNELLFRRNSCSSSILDIDDSEASRLNWTTSFESDEQYNSCKENLSVSSKSSTEDEKVLRQSKDNWARLTMGQCSKVLLCNFFHPNRVYIRNSDLSSRLSDLTKRIVEFTSISENLKQLTNVEIGQNCLAKIDDQFHRAKIIKKLHDTDGSTAEVLFVDFGEFLILPLSELVRIPKRFITELPFQAIFCKLVGIRPINNSTEWCDTTCDTIYDNVLSQESYFYARPIRPGSRDKYAYGLQSCSYDVVLFGEASNVNINNWIVSHQYGEFEPETSHFLDILGYNDLSEETDFSKFDIEFDDDDMIKVMEANNIPFSYEKPIESLPAVIEEIPKETRIHESLMKKLAETTSSNFEKYGELTSLYKFPNINWQQSDSVIVLTVYAPDVDGYYLKVTPRIVNLCFIINNQKFATVLNLFGCVDVDHTSHEIRGINIVIRLLKTLAHPWPRLIQNKGKYSWLKYNLEAVNEDRHSDSTFEEQIELGSIHPPHFSSSESDNDDDDDYVDLDSD